MKPISLFLKDNCRDSCSTRSLPFMTEVRTQAHLERSFKLHNKGHRKLSLVAAVWQSWIPLRTGFSTSPKMLNSFRLSNAISTWANYYGMLCYVFATLNYLFLGVQHVHFHVGTSKCQRQQEDERLHLVSHWLVVGLEMKSGVQLLLVTFMRTLLLAINIVRCIAISWNYFIASHEDSMCWFKKQREWVEDTSVLSWVWHQKSKNGVKLTDLTCLRVIPNMYFPSFCF